jgi:hypothetical protein
MSACATGIPERTTYKNTSDAERLQRAWRNPSNSLSVLPKKTKFVSRGMFGSEGQFSHSEKNWIDAVAQFVRENGFPDFDVLERLHCPNEEALDDYSGIVYIFERCKEIHKTLSKGTAQQILALLNQLSQRYSERTFATLNATNMVALSNAFDRLFETQKSAEEAENAVNAAKQAAEMARQLADSTTSEDEDDWEAMAEDSPLPEEVALQTAMNTVRETSIAVRSSYTSISDMIRTIVSNASITRDEKMDFFVAFCRNRKYRLALLDMCILSDYIVKAIDKRYA